MSRPAYVSKTKPFDHQEKIENETGTKADWAYFMEMGTGKTKINIDISGKHFAAGNIDAVLVIAPGGCYRNWEREYETHYGNEYSVCAWTSASTPKMQRTIAEWIDKDRDHLKVFLINVEALNFKGGTFAERFCRKYKDRVMMIVDESTCIKNYKAKRTKAVKALKSYTRIRRILTGTPVTKAPSDLWGQCLALKGQPLGDKSFTSFKNRYAIEETKHFGSHSFRQIVGWRNLDQLNEIVQTFSTIMEKKECHDIPRLYIPWEVEMTPEQKKIYQDLRDLAFAEIQDTIVDVKSAMTLMGKLHQVACGQIKVDGETIAIPNNRTQATLDIIDGLHDDKKVIIWSGYIATIQEIITALQNQYGEEAVVDYYGATSKQQRIVNDQRFREDPTCRFMVSNQQTGGEGNDWYAASYQIFYSNTASLKDRLQAEGRIDRMVQQESQLTYIDLKIPGTVDERYLDILRSNREISSMVMGTELSDWI